MTERVFRVCLVLLFAFWLIIGVIVLLDQCPTDWWRIAIISAIAWGLGVLTGVQIRRTPR